MTGTVNGVFLSFSDKPGAWARLGGLSVSRSPRFPPPLSLWLFSCCSISASLACMSCVLEPMSYGTHVIWNPCHILPALHVPMLQYSPPCICLLPACIAVPPSPRCWRSQPTDHLTAVRQNLPLTKVQRLTLEPYSDTLVAATYGRGVYLIHNASQGTLTTDI